MDANSQPRKSLAHAIPPLGTAIKVANLAKLVSGMTPATAVCFCVIILLTLIQVRLSLFSVDLFHVERNQDFMANRTDYIEFGQACLDVCGTLSQLMNGKKLEDLSQAWHRAITQLTMWVESAIHDLDSSDDALGAELWRTSKRKPSGTSQSSLMQRSTRVRSLLGSQTSVGSSPGCVQSFWLGYCSAILEHLINDLFSV